MIKVELYPASKQRVTYILLPMPIPGLQQLAIDCDTSIVGVLGIDWDNDLTPWTAPGVLPHDLPFKGEARRFLTMLQQKVIPAAEAQLPLDVDHTRNLCGISLSGLFATWAWMQDDTFHSIAGISSSFWYDNFVEWLSTYPIPHKSGGAYLSLGNREGTKHDNPRYQTVQQDTHRVVEILRHAGIDVLFEQTEGTHFAPPMPRLYKALTALRQL